MCANRVVTRIRSTVIAAEDEHPVRDECLYRLQQVVNVRVSANGLIRIKLLLAIGIFTFITACARVPTAESNPLTDPQWIRDSIDSVSRVAAPAPSHDRYWKTEQSVMPYAQLDDQGATIRNIRNCRWKTESDREVRHEDWTVRWQDCEGVDFVVVPFQHLPMLAHTMLAFRFTDGRALVLSVEARLEEGEIYTPLAGAARQFELIYILGKEEDLYGLRAEVRRDDLFLYRSRATAEQSQELLKNVLQRINALAAVPEFYDSLTNNCTTNIVAHIQQLRGGSFANEWRSRVPGHSDHMAYDMGLIDTDLPFEEARRQAWTSGRIRQFLGQEDFSRKIRSNELLVTPQTASPPRQL